MKFLFLIKYWTLLKIFDSYKDKAIGNKSWYSVNIHARIEKYLALNADIYCDIINNSNTFSIFKQNLK